MKVRNVMTDVFLTCIAEHFQFVAIGPQDDAIRSHPMHANRAVLNEIAQLLLSVVQSFLSSFALADVDAAC